MSKVENALNSFKKGFNCSQAVLSVFAPQMGLNLEKSLKIATAFGGGMARLGETCGVVTGALMVIGLKHGMVNSEEKTAKINTYKIANEFIKEFESRNNSIVCKKLIDCDLSTPEGLEEAKKNEVFKMICPLLVKDSVEILEEIL